MAQTPEEIKQAFADLDYTQQKRKKLVDKTFDKAIEANDMDTVVVGLKAMDGMDKQALGKLKIDGKEKENQTRADESAAMAALLVSLSNNKPRTRREDAGQEQVTRKMPASLRPEYDPSIRDASPLPENSNEFRERMDKQT